MNTLKSAVIEEIGQLGLAFTHALAEYNKTRKVRVGTAIAANILPGGHILDHVIKMSNQDRTLATEEKVVLMSIAKKLMHEDKLLSFFLEELARQVTDKYVEQLATQN